MNKTLRLYKLIAEIQTLIEGDDELTAIAQKEMFNREEPESGGPKNEAPECREYTKEEQEAIERILDSWGD